MADLVVRAVDLTAVAASLRAAVAEADGLPSSVGAVHIELDVRGGPVASAAAELVEAWWAALDLMVDSGRGLLEWLDDVDEAYARAERELAQAAGRPGR